MIEKTTWQNWHLPANFAQDGGPGARDSVEGAACGPHPAKALCSADIDGQNYRGVVWASANLKGGRLQAAYCHSLHERLAPSGMNLSLEDSVYSLRQVAARAFSPLVG